jgi:hypothetical protein
LMQEVQKLRAMGKTVVLVKDCPKFGFDPEQHIRISLIPLRRIVERAILPQGQIDGGIDRASRVGSAEDDRTSEILDRIAASNPGTAVYDPKKTLCDSQDCVYRDGQTVFYIDSQHLSLDGAKRALRGLHLLPIVSMLPIPERRVLIAR